MRSAPMLASCVVWSMVAVAAAEDRTIEVEATSPRIPLLAARPEAGRDGIDPRLEASAVEPIGDGSMLLVADDKTPGLVVIDARTGRRVGVPLDLGPLAAGPIAPKWEAMARDGEFFYVIGSHSGKTARERAARARLLRFRLGGTNPPAIDPTSVVAMDLARSLAEVEGFRTEGDTKADDPVKIEGLTIRPIADGRELVIGLRKPNDTIRAYAARLPDSAGTPPASLTLRRLFAFEDAPVGDVRRELGSLEYSPEWHGFFIVTLCEDEANHFEENVLWFLADNAIKAEGLSNPTRVWSFARGFKCEGLGILPDGTAERLRLVLSFDNDAATTKMPSLVQTITLRRSAK